MTKYWVDLPMSRLCFHLWNLACVDKTNVLEVAKCLRGNHRVQPLSQERLIG